jgi:hypothetical protein
MAGGAPRATVAERSAAPAQHAAGADAAEAARLARVPRHRLALALAVTAASLPLLVLDNLPATAASAEKGEPLAAATSQLETHAAPSTTVALAPSTTTPPAPPPSAVIAVIEAPTTTVAPAPTTTTTAAPAPRPVASLRKAPTPPPAPTTTTTTTSTTPPPAPSGQPGDPNDPASWDRLAQCEAGGNWAANTGNGYYGGLQFSLATWQNYGGTGYPHQASKATQIEIGKRLQAARGWGAWPGCARSLGYI